ncbi:DUF3810 domain-containing protein [Proteiniphilum sp. X52]|uniref:DUF3810 domain-containing protein n=1 Tax=Proteiniphilum sp. X52 TaxID=2382159 RepID=UPI000F0A8FA3|nr:DUF3810 domain-containing protein [Proteiniphilum sp. X52]RNC65871.1 DUF3810 domain-containing protein [Proteiniphilum sp. X52]
MISKHGYKVQKRQFALLLIISVALFAIIFLFSLSATLSEWYMRGVYPILAAILSFISNLFPFSLYDIFLVVAVLLLIKLVVFTIIRKTSFLKFLFLLIRFVTVIVAWFYFSWGIAYFREDFYDRTDITEMTFDPEIFRDFAVRFIARANLCYTDCADLDRQEARREIELSYRRMHGMLRITYPNGKRKPKPMMFESVYSKMGVSGYFGPFFNEIHVNDYGLNFAYPFTLAHEMAHQFGIAAESEANLYAFVVCSLSGDEKIRYSAYLSTLRYVLSDTRKFLPDEYESLVSSIRPEIIADLRRNREHWLAARDEALSEVQDRVYDAYLKTNKVSAGQDNYSQVVGLLISVDDIFTEWPL